MRDEDETMNGLESEPISWKELIGATLPAAAQQSDCPGIRDTQNWADLAGPSHIYPEYENRARNIIMTRLGYLPNPNVIAAYDIFLRAAAHALDHGHLKIEQYDETANALVTQIRNKDMILYDELNISQSLHTQYEEQKNTFSGLFVRDRIINMLGQTLDIEITLPAELMLQFMVDEGMSFDDRPNELDIRALTIIGYRKALLEDGKEAANQSPLWYYDFAQSNGYFETQGPYARIPNIPMSH
jgi:hypothetical protein